MGVGAISGAKLEHYPFEMPRRHLSGDAKQAVGHSILRLRGEAQAGDRNSVQRELVPVTVAYDLNTQDSGEWYTQHYT